MKKIKKVFVAAVLTTLTILPCLLKAEGGRQDPLAEAQKKAKEIVQKAADSAQETSVPVQEVLNVLSRTPTGNPIAIYLATQKTEIIFEENQSDRFGQARAAQNRIVLSPLLKQASREFLACILAYHGSQLKSSKYLYDHYTSPLQEKVKGSGLKADSVKVAGQEEYIQTKYLADLHMLRAWKELETTPERDYMNFMTLKAKILDQGRKKYEESLKRENPKLEDLSKLPDEINRLPGQIRTAKGQLLDMIGQMCSFTGMSWSECREQKSQISQAFNMLLKILKPLIPQLSRQVKEFHSSVEEEIGRMEK